MAKPRAVNVYSLARRGVVVDNSDVHTADEELLHAQNFQVDAVGGRGSVRRRDGMAALNATPLAGPVLGGIGVPLADRTLLARVFYLALNDGINSFKTSSDGVTWTNTSLLARPVREGTLGADAGTLYGDSALLWIGGERVYYPGDDYSAGALALPSLHMWDGADDTICAYIPVNPLDLANTVGPFGITSMVRFSASQLLIAIADRNSSGQGRSRVLLLDEHDGTLQQLGASAVLNAGHVITGMVVWQGRVWIVGVNKTTGGPLVTFWINPEPVDAEWTQDDSFGTQHGFGTGLAVFKGELYQASAAESGQSALIRRRAQSAAGSSTVTTAVSVGTSSVAGVATVVARPAPPAIAAYQVSGGGIEDEAGDWRAQVTWKYADGVESLPSPASGPVTIGAGAHHGIQVFPLPAGDANVTQRLVYLKKPSSATYDGNALQTFYNTPGVFTQPDNDPAAIYNVNPQTAGSTRHPPSADPGYLAGATYLYVDDCSQFLSGGGSARVGSNTFTYTGRTASSGRGALTGVSGITGTIANGAAIAVVVAVSATIIPILDTTNFFAAGTAAVGGNTVTWTGRSTTSGRGNLTGVSGVSTAIVAGSAIVAASVPIASTELPIADTTFFASAGGSATAAGQAITYTGRSTTSGRGLLTGVSGITPAIANGATVSFTAAGVTVWTTVYTSAGTTANNYVGPLIVTQDGAKILGFLNRAGASAPVLQIIESSDGVVWGTAYNISTGLSNSYTRSGMPLLDDNGDIYWPLASGSAGGAGGLLKRTAAGAWSIVLSAQTNIRGPLMLLRA